MESRGTAGKLVEEMLTTLQTAEARRESEREAHKHLFSPPGEVARKAPAHTPPPTDIFVEVLCSACGDVHYVEAYHPVLEGQPGEELLVSYTTVDAEAVCQTCGSPEVEHVAWDRFEGA